jgi:hypothetical protein
MIKRTREEREALVKQWRESGKRMSTWCSEHKIPITTFCGWTYIKKASKRNKVIARDDFTELRNEASVAKVLIEWRGCKIHVDPQTASTVLEKCLPIIGRFSC